MSIFDTPSPSLYTESVELQKLAIQVGTALRDMDVHVHEPQLHAWRNEMTRQFVYSLKAYVLADHLEAKRVVMESCEPERPIDYLLVFWTWFWREVAAVVTPGIGKVALWLATRWPARWITTRQVELVEQGYRACPHLPVALPKDQHKHLFWLKHGEAA